VETVILCGGKGSRLSELTSVKPKPLVEVGGKPILHHIMNSYAKFNYTNFILATGYLGQQIQLFASQNSGDFKINTIDTGEHTLTGGRLLRLKSLLENNSSFMLTYGDGICDVNIDNLLSFHKSHGKIATVTAVRPPARFGVLKLSNNKVEYFKEKSQTDSGWINGGYFVFNTEIFNFLESDLSVLEEHPLEKLSQLGELMAYQHNGFWQCMDTLRDKEFLDELCAKGTTPWL
jgi:glucose-1-phosphate cytidylyltransferase